MRRWIGLAAFIAPMVIVLVAGAQAQGTDLVNDVAAQVATVTMR